LSIANHSSDIRSFASKIYFGTAAFLSGFEIGGGAWALIGGMAVFCTGFGGSVGDDCGLDLVI
jgi:hypothetical protein